MAGLFHRPRSHSATFSCDTSHFQSDITVPLVMMLPFVTQRKLSNLISRKLEVLIHINLRDCEWNPAAFSNQRRSTYIAPQTTYCSCSDVVQHRWSRLKAYAAAQAHTHGLWPAATHPYVAIVRLFIPSLAALTVSTRAVLRLWYCGWWHLCFYGQYSDHTLH